MAKKTAIKDVTVIWHLGFQKTGTTIFQSLMRRNSEWLEERIAIFPKRKWTRALENAGLAHWADPSKASEKTLAAEARAIRDAVREQGHTFGVFSDENVIGLELYDEKGGMFDMAKTIMPILEKAIAPAKSEFVFYTRDFDKWFKSAHNQVVKQLRCRDDFDTWVENAPFHTDWEKHHKDLSKCVKSPVIFRDLGEDAANDMPMGGHILERAGISPKDMKSFNKPIGRNESLSPGALAFMLDLNRSHMHDRGLDIVRRKMLNNPQSFT